MLGCHNILTVRSSLIVSLVFVFVTVRIPDISLTSSPLFKETCEQALYCPR